MTQQRQYVLCPSCGEPLPEPLPRSGEFIRCTHCQNMFPFDEQAVAQALIEYHALECRWVVVPILSEMGVQATHILDFCTQAAPGCMVHVIPLGPNTV